MWNRGAIFSVFIVMILACTFLSFKTTDGSGETDKENSTGILLDTFENTITLHFNKDGLPEYYKSDVFTPVCHTGECLPIKIHLYWDLGGNYIKYELPNEETLTKVDHIPFTEDDYRMLHSILRNKKSELRNYTYDDLIFKGKPDSTEQDVDGVSGATITGLKGHYVPDALYSSHTLWHLSNGRIKADLQKYTENKLFNKYPINYFITNTKTNCQAQAIRYMSRNGNDNFTNTLIGILDTANENITNLAIELFPTQKMNEANVRNALLKCYDKTAFESSKLLVLERWKEVSLNKTEILTITKGFGKKYALFKHECTLLSSQNKWPEETFMALLNFVETEPNLKRKETAFKMLRSKEDQLPKSFKKQYRKLAKANHFII